MNDFTTLSQNSRKYPKLLHEISNPPKKLYARGNLALLESNCFAIVGTRANTVNAEANTRFFTRGLVSYGLTIVSGLAFGIDAIAHQETLEHGGQTIAVLGNGIDEIRPAANEWLGKSILENNGLILSEYPPGTPTQAHHFPARNRIISGLSVGTLVVEAPKKSGALITAQRAFEQSREVFVVPGALREETMQGNNHLIANDVARLVRTPEDIIAHLREQPALFLEPLIKKTREPRLTTQAQKQVFNLLSKNPNTPFDPDNVLKKTKLSIVEVSVALAYLELKGHIKNLGYGQYMCAT
ncbi:DNA-protecting protein DprA [Candidatus Peregrinibacteria bacterium]|jgi:DNA processing protein|nr:DNA-protecting protein DprA [Candidatus Peregrinibacteria bacterium]MBT7702731.1 DNA-protecting protein DprA [Candidatus Peregrinibacteria bacterium]